METEQIKKESFFKQHIEPISICITIIGSIFISTCWMNGKFNEIDKKFYEMHEQIAVIKTVLVMKNIYPSELVKHDSEKEGR